MDQRWNYYSYLCCLEGEVEGYGSCGPLKELGSSELGRLESNWKLEKEKKEKEKEKGGTERRSRSSSQACLVFAVYLSLNRVTGALGWFRDRVPP